MARTKASDYQKKYREKRKRKFEKYKKTHKYVKRNIPEILIKLGALETEKDQGAVRQLNYQVVPELGNSQRENVPELENNQREIVPELGNSQRENVPELETSQRENVFQSKTLAELMGEIVPPEYNVSLESLYGF